MVSIRSLYETYEGCCSAFASALSLLRACIAPEQVLPKTLFKLFCVFVKFVVSLLLFSLSFSHLIQLSGVGAADRTL